MDNKKRSDNKILGWILIPLSLILIEIFLLYLGISKSQTLNRYLFCNILATFGFGVRLVLYSELFKPKATEEKDIKSLIYYWLMLIMIVGFIYLAFYNTLYEMPTMPFIILSAVIFTIMGLTVKTVIEKFGLGS